MFGQVLRFEKRVNEVKFKYEINKHNLEDSKAAIEQANSKALKASSDAILLEDVSYNILQ